jgi:hypothetical protein
MLFLLSFKTFYLSFLGMVGAINAPTSGNNTFQAFQTSAKAFTGKPGVRQFPFHLLSLSSRLRSLYSKQREV